MIQNVTEAKLKVCFDCCESIKEGHFPEERMTKLSYEEGTRK